MNCPRCGGNITAGIPGTAKHDIRGYEIKTFLLKIAGHDFFFHALEYMYQIPGDFDPRWERVRYEWGCDLCGYTWDLIWPMMLEVDGKKVP